MNDVSALTGSQQAAVILAQLGDDRALAILNQLSENDVVMLMAAVAQLPSLDGEHVTQVTSAFIDEVLGQGPVRQGGVETARRWLHDRLGSDRADLVLAQLESLTAPEPLDLFEGVEPSELARLLADEHPQTIALVVSTLRRESAAELLGQFDDQLATDVVRRLATTTTVADAVVQRVSQHFAAQMSRLGVGAPRAGGVANAASVLNNVAHGADQTILAGIERADPTLAEAIRSEMFLFDDVLALDDATLQVVLRSATLREVALALKSATTDVVDKFMSNVSARVAEDLAEEIEGLGPQRRSAVQAAQSSLVRLVLELTDADMISLDRSGEELVV